MSEAKIKSPVYVQPAEPIGVKPPFFVQVLGTLGVPSVNVVYVYSNAIDDYRLKQLESQGAKAVAGEVFTRLGVPLPAIFNERSLVRVTRIDGPLCMSAEDHPDAYQWVNRLTRHQLTDSLTHCLELLNGSKAPITQEFAESQLADVLRRRAEFNKAAFVPIFKDGSQCLCGGDFL